MRLMSDVPLGMFLSGGVDSSAIAALMKRMRQRPSEDVFRGLRRGALQRTRLCARRWRAPSARIITKCVIGMEDFFNALPRLIWHEDEPIAWPSSVSLYFVSKLAAEHVKVVLTGEGSDELFGGYERYRDYLFNSRGGLSLYRACRARLRAAFSAQLEYVDPCCLPTAPQAAAYVPGPRRHCRIAVCSIISMLRSQRRANRRSLLKQAGAPALRELSALLESRAAIRCCPECSMPIRRPIWWNC